MKRPGDRRPDPPGGRAAERLREYEDARLPPGERERREREGEPDELLQPARKKDAHPPKKRKRKT
jgi:hypothetical protein